MNIQIKKLTNNEIAKQKIHTWPIWTCGVSEFDWEYTEQESCLLLEGEVEVTTATKTVKISVGDFVVFPEGLKCRWRVTQPVKKHYKFG